MLETLGIKKQYYGVQEYGIFQGTPSLFVELNERASRTNIIDFKDSLQFDDTRNIVFYGECHRFQNRLEDMYQSNKVISITYSIQTPVVYPLYNIRGMYFNVLIDKTSSLKKLPLIADLLNYANVNFIIYLEDFDMISLDKLVNNDYIKKIPLYRKEVFVNKNIMRNDKIENKNFEEFMLSCKVGGLALRTKTNIIQVPINGSNAVSFKDKLIHLIKIPFNWTRR